MDHIRWKPRVTAVREAQDRAEAAKRLHLAAEKERWSGALPTLPVSLSQRPTHNNPNAKSPLKQLRPGVKRMGALTTRYEIEQDRSSRSSFEYDTTKLGAPRKTFASVQRYRTRIADGAGEGEEAEVPTAAFTSAAEYAAFRTASLNRLGGTRTLHRRHAAEVREQWWNAQLQDLHEDGSADASGRGVTAAGMADEAADGSHVILTNAMTRSALVQQQRLKRQTRRFSGVVNYGTILLHGQIVAVDRTFRLTKATKRGDTDAVLRLLAPLKQLTHSTSNVVCNVNERDASGSTPLIHCVWDGYIDVARALIDHGADVFACTRRGNTALHFAYERGWVELIGYLREVSSTITKKKQKEELERVQQQQQQLKLEAAASHSRRGSQARRTQTPRTQTPRVQTPRVATPARAGTPTQSAAVAMQAMQHAVRGMAAVAATAREEWSDSKKAKRNAASALQKKSDVTETTEPKSSEDLVKAVKKKSRRNSLRSIQMMAGLAAKAGLDPTASAAAPATPTAPGKKVKRISGHIPRVSEALKNPLQHSIDEKKKIAARVAKAQALSHAMARKKRNIGGSALAAYVAEHGTPIGGGTFCMLLASKLAIAPTTTTPLTPLLHHLILGSPMLGGTPAATPSGTPTRRHSGRAATIASSPNSNKTSSTSLPSRSRSASPTNITSSSSLKAGSSPRTRAPLRRASSEASVVGKEGPADRGNRRMSAASVLTGIVGELAVTLRVDVNLKGETAEDLELAANHITRHCTARRMHRFHALDHTSHTLDKSELRRTREEIEEKLNDRMFDIACLLPSSVVIAEQRKKKAEKTKAQQEVMKVGAGTTTTKKGTNGKMNAPGRVEKARRRRVSLERRRLA